MFLIKCFYRQRVLYATCLFEATSQQCGTLAASYRLRLFDVAQKAMSWTDICSCECKIDNLGGIVKYVCYFMWKGHYRASI